MTLTKGRAADVTVAALTSGNQCKIIYTQLHKKCFAFGSQLHRTAESDRPEAYAQGGSPAAPAVFTHLCCACDFPAQMLSLSLPNAAAAAALFKQRQLRLRR